MFKLNTRKSKDTKAAATPRPLSTSELESVSGGIKPQPLPPIARSTINRDV